MKAIEAAGIALTEVFRAAAAGDAALELLGEVTQRLKNSISYVLTWLATDAIDGSAVVGPAQGRCRRRRPDRLGRQRAVQKEVVAELLAAGTTIAQLVADTIRHPQHALDNLTALRELGKTVGDIVQSAFIQPTRDLQKKVIQSLKDIGEGLLDVLKGVIEAGVGALDVAIAVILEVFGKFRSLRAEEKADAKLVYKTSVPLNDVQIYEGSFVSGMSDWFRDEAVAVTTMRIVHLPDNFDTTTRGNRHTLIHELGHVWQGENTGPYYIGHALFSQVTMGSSAYNYGGTTALKANHDAGGKLDHQPGAAGADHGRLLPPAEDGNPTTDYDPYIVRRCRRRDAVRPPGGAWGTGGPRRTRRCAASAAAYLVGKPGFPTRPERRRGRRRDVVAGAPGAGPGLRAVEHEASATCEVEPGPARRAGCRGCRGTVAGRRPAACAADSCRTARRPTRTSGTGGLAARSSAQVPTFCQGSGTSAASSRASPGSGGAGAVGAPDTCSA